MTLENPINAAYCANIAKISHISPIPGKDRIVTATILGFNVVVSKDHNVGDVGVFFPPETQLSDAYMKVNNLYRHSDLNLDKGVAGYMDDNGRIRAIKFGGAQSHGLFMPLHSLDNFVGNDYIDPKVGDEFDFLNGIEICRKYVVYTREQKDSRAQTKKESRVDSIHMPEHISTDQLYKVIDSLDKNLEVIVTQKLHGTSIRIGHTYVARKLTLKDKIASFFGAYVQTHEHDYVYGSRKVIKDAENPDQKHYYDADVWSDEGKKLFGLLPENYLVYAELIGTLPGGKEIQKNYTYGFDTPQLYVYRIAIVNSKGQTTDLSWDSVVEFCTKNGIKAVPELWRGKIGKFNLKKYMDKVYSKTHKTALPLGKDDIVDEGIVLRVEGLTPYLMKAKSPLFYQHETEVLDTGVEDLESSQS